MKSLGKNEELIKVLSDNLSLLSAKLYKIDIYEDSEYGLTIELYLELLYAKTDKFLTLKFTGIEEFSFYHHRTYYFYNIERYKFFKIESGFYISLDPNSEDEVMSSEDQDFILSTNVEGSVV
jgi:hypothetical protein